MDNNDNNIQVDNNNSNTATAQNTIENHTSHYQSSDTDVTTANRTPEDHNNNTASMGNTSSKHSKLT